MQIETIDVEGVAVPARYTVGTDPPVVWENPYTAYPVGDMDGIARIDYWHSLYDAIVNNREPNYGALEARKDVVDAGKHDRENCLVHAALTAGAVKAVFEASAVAVQLVELAGDGAPGREVPAQLDEQGNLTWLLAGRITAGQQRRYVADLSTLGSTAAQIEIATRTDHLVLSAAGTLMARYVFLGTWK